MSGPDGYSGGEPIPPQQRVTVQKYVGPICAWMRAGAYSVRWSEPGTGWCEMPFTSLVAANRFAFSKADSLRKKAVNVPSDRGIL